MLDQTLDNMANTVRILLLLSAPSRAMAELMAAASLTMRPLPCAQAVLFAVGDTIGQGSSRKAGSPWDWPRALPPSLFRQQDATLAPSLATLAQRDGPRS